MNKKLKTLIATSVITVAMGATALADTNATTNGNADELVQAIQQLGVSQSEAGNISSYLQSITITNDQKESAMDKITKAKDIIGSESDITKLSLEEKNELQKLAVEAGNTLGLIVKFDKVNGFTTATVTTAGGGTLLSLDTKSASHVLTNFDEKVVINVLEKAVEFSNGEFQPVGDGTGMDDRIEVTPEENPADQPVGDGTHMDRIEVTPQTSKPVYKPVYKPVGGGTLNNTATPYGNLMMAGSTLISMAGGLHVLSKKRK